MPVVTSCLVVFSPKTYAFYGPIILLRFPPEVSRFEDDVIVKGFLDNLRLYVGFCAWTDQTLLVLTANSVFSVLGSEV